MNPKNALVLSGGGSRGAFQIGVLDVLIGERGIDFKVLCGVSVGALHAAALSQAPWVPDDPTAGAQNLRAELDRLKTLWLEQIRGDASIYSKRFLSVAGALFGADSIYEPVGLRALLRDRLNPARVVASGRKLKIGLVNLETGEYRTVGPDPEQPDRLRDQVLASATMPFYFPPVKTSGSWLADGGLRNITPLAEAFHERPDAIVAVFTSPLGRKMKPRRIEQGRLWLKANAFTFLQRTVEILVDEVYNTDLDGARDWNAAIRAWQEIRSSVAQESLRTQLDGIILRKHFAPVHVIQPLDAAVVDHSALDFSPDRIRRAYEHGREVARQFPDLGQSATS